MSLADAHNEVNDDYGLLEYGFLCRHSPSGTEDHVFAEVPESFGNAKIFPGGKYFCIQSEESQLENAAEIFREQLTGNSFLAIETDIYTGRFKINKPVNELRVIQA